MGYIQILMAAASVGLAYGGTYAAEQLMDRMVGNPDTGTELALEEDRHTPERQPTE
jgi:hypothetical protein